MLDDLYLMAVVAKHRVAEGPEATPERIRRQLAPALRRWGGRHLEGVTVSGSYAKGTAIRGATLAPADVDVDLLLSLGPDAPDSLADYQARLARDLMEYQPMMGNVSVKLLVDNIRVDLTVGRRSPESRGHTLWQHRRGTWIRTNVTEQIRFVRESGRRDEILAAKVWRRKQGLYFPSFCLELAVIRAPGTGTGGWGLGARVIEALRFLAEEFPATVLRDPANGSNVVSDLMTEAEKRRVAHAAWRSARAESWTEVV
jgi:hypothetical protein